MDKKTKLIIGGIAVAFMLYILLKKPKNNTVVIGGGGKPVVPNPADTLPPSSEKDFLYLAKAYGATKEEACMNKGLATVTLYMKSAGISPTNTIFYYDETYTTPVKAGYYSDKYDTLFVVSDGGVLTEITTCI